MEICYYWIDKYNDFIEKQGFNFGGEFLFDYITNEKKLIIRKNEKYIKDFFNSQHQNIISNITAIVGKNGVGKSTIIQALKGLLLDGGIIGREDETIKEGYYFPKRILVIKEENEYKLVFHKDLLSINSKGEYNIVYEDIEMISSPLSFLPISYGTKENAHTLKNHMIRVAGTEVLQDTAGIYFSNVFDSNRYSLSSMQDREYFDISNKGLLNKINKDENVFLNADIDKGSAYHLQEKDFRFGNSILDSFLTRELEFKIRALQDKQSRKEIETFMALPDKIILSLDYISYKSKNFNFLDVDTSNLLRSEKKQSELNKLEKLIYQKVRNLTSDNSLSSLAKKTFYLRIIDAYFTDVDNFIRFESRIKALKDKLEQIVQDNFTELDIVDLLNILSKTMLGMHQNGELDASKDFDTFNKFNKFSEGEFLKLHNGYVKLIKFFEENIEDDCISFQKGSLNTTEVGDNGVTAMKVSDIAIIEISLNNKGLKMVENFLQIYRAMYSRIDFITFMWKGISSGEDALLSILSRFYHLRARLVNKNVIIFLDEGELYLHPEWQRKYIDILTSYLKRIFSGSKRIQIIFSTNSPLLISDLPNHNIIFLNRFSKGQAHGKCRVENNGEFPETFAANIHNLMVNGFFMESTIGEFSVKKTNEVIDFLKKSTEEDMDIEEFIFQMKKNEAVISLIGEPILRRKLNYMLEEKKQSMKAIMPVNIPNIEGITNLDELREMQALIEQKINSLEKNGDNI
ncbi:hypothetical protein [Priestia megaterium]|uniref:hypothetical protein n=1 Tax=Priestia megaterium TaxID=1404 RepID=UPI002EB0D266|nr:hypothetical protein [Priestia megaterium]